LSFLTAATSAAIRLGVNKPSAFFSGTGRFEQEIVDLANEVATDIIKAHDWRALIKQERMVGDGVTTAFDLPVDYDRMPKNADVGRMNWYTWGYVDAPDLNFWNDLINGLASPSPGYWIMLGGQMQFIPPVSADTTAEYYYVSKAIAVDADTGLVKNEFTKDSDTFVLDERLLTLGLIWRWRSMKRLDYTEDMKNYEIRLEQLSGEDKGSRVIRMGKRDTGWNYSTAYPRQLGS
jgi:hypothetical protein